MRIMSKSRVVMVRKLKISRTHGTPKFWRIILKCKRQGRIVPVLKYSTTAKFYKLLLKLCGTVVALSSFRFKAWRSGRRFIDFWETLCFKALYIALSALNQLTIGPKCLVWLSGNMTSLFWYQTCNRTTVVRLNLRIILKFFRIKKFSLN
jgi:hypothetical protein